MLRFDDCICGTTTTGTATLALAAPPAAFGGIDPDVWARATGVGFGNSAAILVDYVITEYTDATSLKEHQKEAGAGTLTLGTLTGIANCTLSRDTIDWTATSLDVQPATVSVKPAGGITIGTAANVLVMISPRTESIPGFGPYFNTTGADANWGLCPDGLIAALGATTGFSTGGARDFYVPFRWSKPMLVKRMSFRVSTYSSVVGSPAVYAGIYDVDSSGHPGKLLYDFTGAAGIAITATGAYSTGASGSGFLLLPGEYYANVCLAGLTSGTAALTGPSAANASIGIGANILGAAAGLNLTSFSTTAGSGTAGARPDPANVTGLTASTGTGFVWAFGLSPT